MHGENGSAKQETCEPEGHEATGKNGSSSNGSHRTVFFSVGEPSGDHHGAALIRSLKDNSSDVRCVGYGGPIMRDAGCELHSDLTQQAVMGFVQAVKHLGEFLRLRKAAAQYFDRDKPDAVVLIDFPGFNWWIARTAKKRGIPVYYYCPPQLWAWAAWRIRKMRRLIDHVLCVLPFEADWFESRGLETTLVGHPFFDEERTRSVDEAFLDQQRELDRTTRLVLLLPGSRTQEVKDNFEDMLRTSDLIRQEVSDVRFAVAAYKESHAGMVRDAIQRFDEKADSALPIETYVGKTPELIRASTCCLSVSGSVSLQLLAHARPTVILYRISRVMFALQQKLRRIKYITLVNLLAADDIWPEDATLYSADQEDAEKVPFPEYLTCRDKTREMASHLIDWLKDPALYQRRVAYLTELRDDVAAGISRSDSGEATPCTVSENAALAILDLLEEGSAINSSING
jgi:lipid-A-disaccharide synthase